MIIRRHKDILAVKEGPAPAVAFHARNLEVAKISEAAWDAMAPSTTANPFSVHLEPHELKSDTEAWTELEHWSSEENPNAQTQQLGQTIRTLTINATQICNLHCTYCAAGGDGTYGEPIAHISIEKTLPQLEYFIHKLSLGERLHLIFLGGEPLLYPNAVKAITESARHTASLLGVSVAASIITNGTLLTEDVVDMLCSINANVTISIDGSPEDHDRARPQRNGKGSSQLAFLGLTALCEKKNRLGRLTIHSVFSKANMRVMKAYEHLSKFPVDFMEFTFDATESDADLSQTFVNEMSQVARMAYEKGGETELRRISTFNSYFEALDSQIRTENYCGAGKSLLSIDANNKIYTCPLEVGKPNELVGEGSQVDAAKLESLQDSLLILNNCNSCWARFLCGGGCLFTHKSLTGSKHRKHPSFCERTRSLITLSLLYYEKSRNQEG